MTHPTPDQRQPATGQRSGVLLSGVDTLCRLLVARRMLDQRGGLDTATFVSGYPGSPLGMFDLALERLGPTLESSRIVHQPGLNEELAAAAVWGSQMGAAVPYEGVDGVVGAWYGKGPGLDRSGDVLKHANMMGAGPNGGVVLFVGDDPSAKSSTLPYDSNLALADASVPVLVPADQQDLFDLGIEAFRLSRFSGSWIGVRIVTAVADGIGTVDLGLDRFSTDDVSVRVDGEPWQHHPSARIVGVPGLEALWIDGRLRAAQSWVELRGLDRFAGGARGRVGIVAAGKTYRDVVGALEACGVGIDRLEEAGVRLLKLALTFPVAPGPVFALADSVDEILVVEEKRPFVEHQLRAILHEAGHPTPVRGKRDAHGTPLVPTAGELTSASLVPLLARAIPDLTPPIHDGRTPLALVEVPGRPPAFCSGCPHNRSTVVPAGSVTGGGVGCHGMIYFEPRHADEILVPPTPMGAEGAHWIGLAPFVGDRHLFQSLGDGTFSHSGILAVRACVAAGVHITFKLLYNSAVAMTGGQDVAGQLTVPALTRELAAEGVSAITVCTDDVDHYGRSADFAPGVTVRPRTEILDVQEELRRHPGVSVLIYDQRCAAEARRLRKRGALSDPPRRVVINAAVCEGCGDCSRISNCLSVLPLDTEFGERRQIHQSSCNKDYSCLEGDCPSFLTFTPKRAKRRMRAATRNGLDAKPSGRPRLPTGELPMPPIAPLRHRFSAYITGIGGTGIVTANRIAARAGVLAGYAVQGVDQTGLSQKAGAVVSHLHIAPAQSDITTAQVADGDADLYLSGDILQAGTPGHLKKVAPGRSYAIVDRHFVPTSSMLQNDTAIDEDALLDAIDQAVGDERTTFLDSTSLAEVVFGTHLPANVVLLGAAFQRGALPLPLDTLETAIREQARDASTNLEAFAWGRHWVVDPDAVERALTGRGDRSAGVGDPWSPSPSSAERARNLLAGSRLPEPVVPLAERRVGQLLDYQGRAVATRWLGLVERAAGVDDEPHEHALTRAVADGWFKLLSYKDEYEVARLHLRMDHAAMAEELGYGDGYRVAFHIHPPTLRRLGLDHKIAIGTGGRAMFKTLAAMRRLRGTPFDLFGYHRHRREERALADEYEGMMADALGSMEQGAYDAVVELARSVEGIRGYGDIKSGAIERWRSQVAELRDRVHLAR